MISKSVLLKVSLVAVTVAATASMLWFVVQMYAVPRVSLPGGAQFDFGTIDEGGDIRHVFTLKNTGLKTLRILDVRTGCGCSKAVAKHTEIARGDSGEIEVAYHARPVRFREFITCYVLTNDPRWQVLQLVLTGEVRFRIFWFPQSVSFYEKAGDTAATREVRFSSRMTARSPLEVEILSTDSRLLQPRVTSDPEGATVTISLLPGCERGS